MEHIIFPKNHHIEEACSDDEFKPNLQNVCIRGKHAYATDGYVMVAVPIDRSIIDDGEPIDGDLLIPRKRFSLLRKLRTGKRIEFKAAMGTIVDKEIHVDDITLRVGDGEGFPGWPSSDKDVGEEFVSIAVNAKLLSKVLRACGEKCVVLYINKADANKMVHIVGEKGAFAGVMPLRIQYMKFPSLQDCISSIKSDEEKNHG